MTGKTKGAQMPRHQEIRIRLLKCGPCFCYKIMVRIQDILRDLGNIRQSPFYTADYVFLGGRLNRFLFPSGEECCLSALAKRRPARVHRRMDDTSSDEGPLTFLKLRRHGSDKPVPPEIQTTASRTSSKVSSRLSIINYQCLS